MNFNFMFHTFHFLKEKLLFFMEFFQIFHEIDLVFDLTSFFQIVNFQFKFILIFLSGMTRAEMTLKVVMSPSESVNAFVEQFFKLLPDADSTEFNRVLEMKSVRKVDQPAYIEYFNTIKPIGKI